MIKQYFTDGLIQIAILLSLLRTDLISLNSNFINYPEVQDIILGQTAAYMPTNFHNHYSTLNSLGGSVHPKAINDHFHSSIFQGLEALYEFRRFDGVNRDISAFLVSDPGLLDGNGPGGSTQSPIPSDLSSSFVNSATHSAVPPASSLAGTSQNSAPQPASETVGIADSSCEPHFEAASIAENNNSGGNTEVLTPNNNNGVGSVTSEAEPSTSLTGDIEPPPPLHLATDPTEEDMQLIDVLWKQDLDLGIAKEAYDAELRLLKEKECEIELQRTKEKERELEVYQLKLEEERKQQQLQFLNEHFTQDGETGEWVRVAGDPDQMVQPSTDCNGNELSIDMDEIMEAALDLLQDPQEKGEAAFNASQYPPHPSNSSDFNMYVPTYTQTSSSGNYSMMNTSGYHQPPTNNTLPSALEEQWNDLLHFLNSGTGEMEQSVPTLAGSTTPPQPLSSLVQELSSAHSALLQNASMPTPAPEPSGLHVPGMNGTGLMPMSMEVNSTMPDSGNTSPLEWEASDFMFPNLTELTSSADMLLPEHALEDMLKEAVDNDAAEEASNDSAVSLGSISPMQQDLSDMATGGCVSPYDGLEGATGGSNYESSSSPRYSKMSKYDPEDFNWATSSYSHSQSDSSHTNFSSSNDSSNLGPPSSSPSSSFSSAHSPFSTSSPNHHVHHNHTYTVPPGQTPREVKAYKEKPKHKGPQSRDEKRARELNIPLTMAEMIDTPVEEFNELMSRHKLTEAQLQLIRDIRRRGKNKIAAQNCRRRKLDVIVHMSDDLSELQEMRDKLAAEREALRAKMRETKEKYSHLYDEIFYSLRDEQGNGYNPEEYSLQQSTDGNVFLVPRSVPRRPKRDEDEPVGSRKRKKTDK